jgi:hypothetical protein
MLIKATKTAETYTMRNKNKTSGFPPHLVKSWEDGDTVNFAIALARVTGWLLHVDWWTLSEEEEDATNMKSLRVYVGDDQQGVFDLRGKQKITSFSQKIVLPILKERGNGKGGVRTRYYSEEKLLTLPLRVKPDLERVRIAEEAIRNNPSFLDKIPKRTAPFIPAYLAADYTFGRCAAYATAMHELTGFPVTAIIADQYTDQFSLSKKGYAHSIVLHMDGIAEDAWGIQPMERILARYGIKRCSLSEDEHWRVNENLKRNSLDKYQEAYEQALSLLKKYILINDRQIINSLALPIS